jgi:hypothetical protein
MKVSYGAKVAPEPVPTYDIGWDFATKEFFVSDSNREIARLNAKASAELLAEIAHGQKVYVTTSASGSL